MRKCIPTYVSNFYDLNIVWKWLGELSSVVSRCEADFNREKIMKFLKERLKDPHVSEAAKFALIKKVVGGLCCQCEGIPAKIVSYDVGNAQLIEKYCGKCFKKWKQREY